MEINKIVNDWNLLDLFFSVVLVVFIILGPLGGNEYLDGRYDTHYFFLDICFIYPTVMIFIIISGIQLLGYWKKYTNRKRVIKTLQVGIPAVFFFTFMISLFTPVNVYLGIPGYKPFTYGFRERIRKEADINDIQAWLKTLGKEDCNGTTVDLFSNHNYHKSNWPDSINWPKSLKVFNPHYVNLDLDENGNSKVKLTWGGPFGHWGFEIGSEDIEMTQSDFNQPKEYRLPLEPGAYIWHE
jgi:hypothetical protein